MRRVTVFCTAQIEGWHSWPNAPDYLAYLRNSHRHMFGVRVEVEVTELDRQIEFIELKHAVVGLAKHVLSGDPTNPTSYSCETMADYVQRQLIEKYPDVRWASVTVDEDGENGATVEWREVSV